MANGDLSFQLDIGAAEIILTQMASTVVDQAANAIAARASSMVSSMSSDPPEIGTTSEVGTIKKGRRAIATVAVIASNAHQNYVGRMALTKAKDAGRV